MENVIVLPTLALATGLGVGAGDLHAAFGAARIGIGDQQIEAALAEDGPRLLQGERLRQPAGRWHNIGGMSGRSAEYRYYQQAEE